MLPPIKKIIKVLIDKNTDLVRSRYGGDTRQNLIVANVVLFLICINKIFDFYQLFFCCCSLKEKEPQGLRLYC